MSTFLVEKKLTLEYLGEDYKDSYITFKVLPFRKYSEIMEKAKQIGEDNEASIKYMQEIVSENFIGGMFKGKELTQDDVAEFDGDTIVHAFQTIAGEPNPKVETPLTNSSPTAESPQPNS